MEETNTTTETRESPAPTPGLVRPVEGRLLAGVAKGLADRLNLPELLVRAAFVLLTFAGGLGIVLYAAGWFLIRSEDEPDSPAERLFSGASGTRSWLGIGLVFLAMVILLDNFTFLDGGIVWAIGLLVVGVLLYTGDFPRSSRKSATTEGSEVMTTTDTAPAVTETKTPSGGEPAGGGTPPTPTPTPPILPPTPQVPREKSYLGRVTIGSMLLAVGILAILDNIPGVPVYPEPRHYLALAVTILGLGLIVGGFAGRARWLILVGVVLVPTLIFSPVFEWDWTSDTFDRTVVVTAFDELEEAYSLDVGNLVIDLTDLPWDGEEIDLSATVDAGNIEIRVPPDVAVIGSGSVDIGRVAGPGQESAGLGSPGIDFNIPGTEGEVDLDLQVDVGNIDVRVRN